ncbi:MAG TPA: hypothetical protein G4N98_06445, partial [Thermoflexia bacterium]|nr:hypothetical protein [Thermoflexia bacterium]
MTIDYAAQALGKVSTLIEQLAEQERLVEKAKRESNKNGRKQAEREVQSLRSDLLEQTDASLVYLYLKAVKTASDVDFRSEWQKEALYMDALAFLKQGNIESLYKTYWVTPTPDLTILPPYSFSLRFTFKLAQPYLSKDDNAFYIVDNPIVRDKVFRLPLVRPSGWKGALRAALWRRGQHEEDAVVQRLFGVTRGEEDGQAGRLYFYPTYFTQIGLEVLNPHPRATGAGQQPLYFECVPQGAEGTFTLLYVPLDGAAAGESLADLAAVAEGV